MVTGLSLMPGAWARSVGGGLPGHSDKLVHAGMYGGCVWLGACAVSVRRQVGFVELVLLVVVAAVYGALMELAQACLPIARSFSWADMVANVMGAMGGALLWRIRA